MYDLNIHYFIYKSDIYIYIFFFFNEMYKGKVLNIILIKSIINTNNYKVLVYITII